MQTRREPGKWHSTPKAEFEADANFYDKQQCWCARADGKLYFLQINKGNNHFAKKHILFPKDTDDDKVAAFDNSTAYLKSKATRKLAHRDYGANTDRQLEKYGQQSTNKNCLLNLKPIGEGGRHIDEHTAIVKIVEAIKTLGTLEKDSVYDVRVDFGTNCVIKARRVNTDRGQIERVSFNSWMNIKFSALYVANDRLAVNLFHADTNQ